MLSSSTSSPRETISVGNRQRDLDPSSGGPYNIYRTCVHQMMGSRSRGVEVACVVAVDSYDVSRTFMHELLWNIHKCVIPR